MALRDPNPQAPTPRRPLTANELDLAVTVAELVEIINSLQDSDITPQQKDRACAAQSQALRVLDPDQYVVDRNEAPQQVLATVEAVEQLAGRRLRQLAQMATRIMNDLTLNSGAFYDMELDTLKVRWLLERMDLINQALNEARPDLLV